MINLKNILVLLLTVAFKPAMANTGCWKKVVLSDSHALAIKNDGTLWAWGGNGEGQLGIGNHTNMIVPTQVGTATTWKDIEVSTLRSFAIQENGSLWAWGNNFYGALGDGTTTERTTPVMINAGPFKQVSAGTVTAAAIKTNGTMWVWGLNNDSMFGTGTNIYESNVPIQTGTDSDWKQVSLGKYHVVALKNNGTLWTWGDNGYGILGNGTTNPGIINMPTQVGTLNTWNFIAGGNDCTLAIRTNGTLWAWGDNNHGILGNGTNGGVSHVPLQVGTLTTWKEVTCGTADVIATKVNGTLWGWGRNTLGELGIGVTGQTNTPTIIGSSNWKQGDVSVNIGAAIKNDGMLWSWGKNTGGQMGTGDTIDSLVPVFLACPTSLGIDDFDYKPTALFPNPVTDRLHISGDTQIERFVIFDAVGKMVMEVVSQREADVNSLANGIYLIKIFTSDGVKDFRFIKI